MELFNEAERKLIVVGMRYQKDYFKGMVNAKEQVFLVPEPSNSVNQQALAVHFTDAKGRTTKIGFIRDQDLYACRNKLKCYPNLGDRYFTATVQSVYQNYLVIHVDNSNYATAQPDARVWVSNGVTSLNNVSSGKIDWSTATIASSTQVKPVPQTTNKETNTMNFNTNSIKDSFFREVKNVAFDITSGKLGVTSKDGISVYTKDGVSVNPITDMGVSLPAFAMRVPVADLKEGDILIGNGDPVFFKEFFVDSKDNNITTGYKTVSLNGAIQEVGVVTNMFFGKNTVLAVKNMFGESTSGDMNPMMMLAMSGMLGGDSSSKIDPMMLMLMSGGMGGGNTGGMNPMMLALLMSKK
jgi:hypothetical protein